MQGAQVLVGELRSCVLCGATKKKKEKLHPQHVRPHSYQNVSIRTSSRRVQVRKPWPTDGRFSDSPPPRPGGLFSVVQIWRVMPPSRDWSQLGVCVSSASSLPSPRRWEEGNHSGCCLSTCSQSSTGGYKRIFVSFISRITLNKTISAVARKNIILSLVNQKYVHEIRIISSSDFWNSKP